MSLMTALRMEGLLSLMSCKSAVNFAHFAKFCSVRSFHGAIFRDSRMPLGRFQTCFGCPRLGGSRRQQAAKSARSKSRIKKEKGFVDTPAKLPNTESFLTFSHLL